MEIQPKDLTIPKHHRRIMCFDTETSGLMPKHRAGTPYPPMEAYPYIMQFSWILYNVTTNQIEEIVNEYVKIPATATINEESIKVHGITREMAEEKGKPIVFLLAKFFEAYMKSDCIVAHNLHFDGELVRKEMWRNRQELLRKISIPERVNMMCGVFTKKFNAAYHIDMFCTMVNTVELCGIEFPKKPAPEPIPAAQEIPTKRSLKLRSREIIVPNTIKESPEPPHPHKEESPEPPPPKEESPQKNARKKFPRLNELYSKLFDDALPENLHNSIIDVLVCLRCFLKVRGAKEMTAQEFNQLIDKY